MLLDANDLGCRLATEGVVRSDDNRPTETSVQGTVATTAQPHFNSLTKAIRQRAREAYGLWQTLLGDLHRCKGGRGPSARDLEKSGWIRRAPSTTSSRASSARPAGTTSVAGWTIPTASGTGRSGRPSGGCWDPKEKRNRSDRQCTIQATPVLGLGNRPSDTRSRRLGVEKRAVLDPLPRPEDGGTARWVAGSSS